MKNLWYSILSLAVFGDSHPLEKRQSEYANLFDPVANPLILALSQNSYKKEYHSSTFPVKGAKRLTIWFGPYKIRASNAEPVASNESPLFGFSMDPAGTGWNAIAGDFPKDITVLKTNTSIVLEDGSKADISSGLYLHHLLFFNTAKQYPSMVNCYEMPIRKYPISLFMAGSEDIGGGIFTTGDGKFNSGYYIGRNDPIMMMGDVVNLSNETRYVYTKADIEYVEGKIPDMMDTSIQMLNVGQCEGLSGFFSAPSDTKQFVLNGSAMDVAADGYLITSRGHLHDGGKDIIVKINDKESCVSTAEYGGVGATRKGEDGTVWATIREMTYCPGPVKVNKGDKITLEARYDFEKHPPRKQMTGEMAEEMALVTFFFATTEEQLALISKEPQPIQDPVEEPVATPQPAIV